MNVLVISEKDTVGRALADEILGTAGRRGPDHVVGQLLSNPAVTVLVTWPNGHAMRLWDPDAYNPDWGSPWRESVLPIIPPNLDFKYGAEDKRFVGRLADWMSRSDEVVNACDAAREGELIFHELLIQAPIRPKVVSRMWIMSTTPSGLRQAWEQRENGNKRKYQDMLTSAMSRQQADWLWGINLTRKVTLVFGRKYPKANGDTTYHIGRVQTSMLRLIRDRCDKVDRFKSEPFYRLHGDFTGPGPFRAEVVAFQEMRHGNVDTHFRAMSDVQEMKRQLTLRMHTEWDVQDIIKREPSSPPPAFDLSDLQESANQIKALRFSAKRTLDLAQALYHKERVISYPRTDCCYFPDHMRAEVHRIRDHLWKNWALPFFPSLKQQALPPPEDRWFDDSKVTDHHGIMPTGEIPRAMSDSDEVRPEYLLWQLIAMRFLHAWLPPAMIQAAQRVLLLPLNDEKTKFYRAFLTCAPVENAGWMEIEEQTFNTRGHGVSLRRLRLEKLFPPCESKKAKLRGMWVDHGATTKPEYPSDAVVLRDMRLARIGTPATQAPCIEEALARGYLYRDLQSAIRIDEDGRKLLALLEEFNVAHVSDPELTASWEKQLDRMEKRVAEKPTREVFLNEVLAEARRTLAILDGAKNAPDVVFCPDTGNRVSLTPDGKRWEFGGKYKNAACFVKLRGRDMTAADYRNIFVADKRGGGPFTFTSQRTSQPYDAYVIWRPNARGYDQWEFKFKRRSHLPSSGLGRGKP